MRALGTYLQQLYRSIDNMLKRIESGPFSFVCQSCAAFAGETEGALDLTKGLRTVLFDTIICLLFGL